MPQYCAYFTALLKSVMMQTTRGKSQRLEKQFMEVHNMKIAVICANGKAGRLIVMEAVEPNLDVTAVVRGEN